MVTSCKGSLVKCSWDLAVYGATASFARDIKQQQQQKRILFFSPNIIVAYFSIFN